MVGPPDREFSQMFVSAASARQVAATFAGAFVTAMLFVSAAVGPLPIA